MGGMLGSSDLNYSSFTDGSSYGAMFQANLQIHEDKKNTFSVRGVVKEGTEIFIGNYSDVFKIDDLIEVCPVIAEPDSATQVSPNYDYQET